MLFMRKILPLFFVLFFGGVLGYKFYKFQATGMSASFEVVWLYLFLFSITCFLFSKKKVLLINSLLIVFVFFIFEIYLILSNNGILSYDEQLGFKRYTSTYAQGYKYGYDEFDNWVSLPNTSGVHENIDFKYEVSYNSYGFRNAELDRDQLKKKNVVVIIGDSFTEGNGAPQDSTMPALLERKLKGRFQVINAGVAGSDPIYGYKLFQTVLQKFDPEVIILAINISDIIDVMCKKGFDRFFPDGKVIYHSSPKWEFFYANSRILRILFVQIFKIDPYLLISESQKDARFKIAYLDIKESIRRFSEYAERNNKKLIVVYTPHLFEFENAQSKMHLDDTFGEALKQDAAAGNLAASVVFLKDTIIKYQLFDTADLYRYYWKHDYHFKPIGYDIWAQVIADDITKSVGE
jgi:lysophospholipase L1-like esterase